MRSLFSTLLAPLLGAMIWMLAAAATPALGDGARGPADLARAMRLNEVIAVMRDEGLAYGDDLRAELFPEADADEWSAYVARVYDPARMSAALEAELSRTLDAEAIDPLIAFYQTDLGQKIIDLELSARRAMMDEAVEQMSVEAWQDMLVEDDNPLLSKVEEFVELNDLIEANVVGAMNANFAFYMGLAEGGAFGEIITPEEIIADVWSQEVDIRIDTREWVFSYLTMAYGPLSEADMDSYIALSATPEGRALNVALFAAFDQMFDAVSRALGQGAAQFMVADEAL